MTLQVYNSVSKETEAFEPLDDDMVRMYVCGQTVYDYMHIGHARTYVAFDIVRRYLEFKGYPVKTVINITDVNDKINTRAESEDRSPWAVAEEYGRINLEDFRTLGIHADAFPKASQYVDEMIALVKTLQEQGYAYEVDGDVFFDVHAFTDYGKLSHQDLADIRPEREDDIIAMEKKRHPEDFVLWKARQGGEHSPTWDSPWGEGVPGWHIECSAMSKTLLGDQFDIHGGGSDLVFPHHEDEIAQTEAATGKEWVRYWMHSGLVRLQDEKMSKSLGNFVPTRELLQEYDPATLRLMIAGTHYRKPLDYSTEKLEQAAAKRADLEQTRERVRATLRDTATVPDRLTATDLETLDTIFEAYTGFVTAMDDDFNTPQALTHLYALETALNAYVDADAPKRPVLERGLSTLESLGQVIGLFDAEQDGSGAPAAALDAVLQFRDALRENGLYEEADELRDTLESAGVTVEDTANGPRWTV